GPAFGAGRAARAERQAKLVLQPRELLLQLSRHPRQLGVALCIGEVGAGLPPLLREPVRALELLAPPPHLGHLAVVVVDGRVRHTLLELLIGALELVDEWLESGHRTTVRAAPAPPRA